MFQWETFLDVARDLARNDQADNEAALRSAISRAYYAVLGAAHQRLVDADWTSPGGSIHLHVWRAYADATDRRRRNVARHGNFLRLRRNDADYKRQFPLPLHETVVAALKAADELFALLEEIDADESRT